MPILIIEPSWALRRHAFSVAAKLAGSENVYEAFDGHHASDIARRKRPSLILCEPSLPDSCGVQLCQWLRPQLKESMFVGFADHEIKNSPFDRTIRKPLKRPDLIRLLKERLTPPGPLPVEKTIRIFLSPAETSWLKFGIFMPEQASIKQALKQTGKEHILWFALIRDGSEMEAEMETPLAEGDILIIRSASS